MPARQSPCNRCNQHVVSPVWFSQRIHLHVEASVCLLTVARCTSWCWWYSEAVITALLPTELRTPADVYETGTRQEYQLHEAAGMPADCVLITAADRVENARYCSRDTCGSTRQKPQTDWAKQGANYVGLLSRALTRLNWPTAGRGV